MLQLVSWKYSRIVTLYLQQHFKFPLIQEKQDKKQAASMWRDYINDETINKYNRGKKINTQPPLHTDIQSIFPST